MFVNKLIVIGKGFDTVDVEWMVEPLDRMDVKAGEDSGSVSGWGIGGLSSGSTLGWIRVVMMVCVREWGVPVRLIIMGTMSTCVPSQCERIAFAKGCIFLMMK
jgi:hypothetical protein